MPGIDPVTNLLKPRKEFNKVLFPVFGLPKIAIEKSWIIDLFWILVVSLFFR